MLVCAIVRHGPQIRVGCMQGVHAACKCNVGRLKRWGIVGVAFKAWRSGRERMAFFNASSWLAWRLGIRHSMAVSQPHCALHCRSLSCVHGGHLRPCTAKLTSVMGMSEPPGQQRHGCAHGVLNYDRPRVSSALPILLRNRPTRLPI